jgi:hypothetical protein
MKKLRVHRLLIIGAFIGLLLFTFFQYQSKETLKTELGQTYLSNISNFKQHINHIETYLSAETEFSAGELNNYYYEVNYLLSVKLPSENSTPKYVAAIQGGLLKLHDYAAKGMNKQEFDIEKNRILQKLINPLKKGLEEMSNVGNVKGDGGTGYNYKEYYYLSIPDNENMKSINDELEKQYNNSGQISLLKAR